MYLERINTPQDLKQFTLQELTCLADEMRQALITKISTKGGHLGSNLGIVELTIVLHYLFDFNSDKVVYDVSHQTYCHKMLTGRAKAFFDPAHYGDVTGFSNPAESDYDLFHMGHTSTSVSLACGLAKARDLRHEKGNVIAVIGDASLDGGEAFEGLNYASELQSGLIVVVNDNDMSIPENYGGLSRHLAVLRNNNGRSKDNFFTALGFTYHYVADGNNLSSLLEVFSKVKDVNEPTVVHVNTQKGKGYKYAEIDKEKWHWASPFDVQTGEFLRSVPAENYGAIVGDYLLDKMKSEPELVVVAASTPICIGFNRQRRMAAGRQYVDVGIAEQNAVSLSAGIAKNGGKPVFATNSTFIQRAYDQIEQEVCLNKLPVVMIVTHGSVFGHGNVTHAGLFDIPLLAHIPYLTYLAPTTKEEYLAMLDWSLENRSLPVAIRVPWTGVRHSSRDVLKDYGVAKYDIARKGENVAIIALGGFFNLGEEVCDKLNAEYGIKATLINPIFITSLDEQTLDSLLANHHLVVTLEDGIIDGGFGSKIAQHYGGTPMRVINLGFSEDVPIAFNPKELMEKEGLTANDICNRIMAQI